jgi:NAD(P)-dependent dehydrogenase (short-subunit alcohol dehydrogenase family)
MKALTGKVAIVTGGAQGIGLASAFVMAEAGATVVIADLNLDGAQRAAERIDAPGRAASAVEVDVSDADQVRAMVDDTVQRHGGVDILLNNAALQTPEVRAGDTDVVNLDLAAWDRTIAVNLRGPMLGCRFAVPEMMKRGGGSIINVSSGAADLADFIRCAYGTSKAGVNALTRYVAAAFGKYSIRCNAIAPGFTITPGVRAVWSDEALSRMVDHHMMPRLGEPDDIADLALFLASDASRHITGQVIHIDGGFSGHLPTYYQTVQARGLSADPR